MNSNYSTNRLSAPFVPSSTHFLFTKSCDEKYAQLKNVSLRTYTSKNSAHFDFTQPLKIMRWSEKLDTEIIYAKIFPFRGTSGSCLEFDWFVQFIYLNEQNVCVYTPRRVKSLRGYFIVVTHTISRPIPTHASVQHLFYYSAQILPLNLNNLVTTIHLLCFLVFTIARTQTHI